MATVILMDQNLEEVNGVSLQIWDSCLLFLAQEVL